MLLNVSNDGVGGGDDVLVEALGGAEDGEGEEEDSGETPESAGRMPALPEMLGLCPNRRLERWRNSNSLKRVLRASSSRGMSRRSSQVTASGTSVMMVANSLDNNA